MMCQNCLYFNNYEYVCMLKREKTDPDGHCKEYEYYDEDKEHIYG